MPELRKFPKGKIKRTSHFYGWTLVGVMFLLIGASAIFSGELNWRSLNLKGNDAYLFGTMLICFGLFFLRYLFFKAERNERDREGFHQLENFTDLIDNYKTTFIIEPEYLPTHNGGALSVFYYKLEIFFKTKLRIKIYIRRRDKFEYFLWKIGLLRFFDVLTGNEYFDSKYRVKIENKIFLSNVLNFKTIKLLEEFDRDYPPIRNKNGVLTITDVSIRYTEGPYNEDQRLFDPHRGIIESLFNELMKIVYAIEGARR